MTPAFAASPASVATEAKTGLLRAQADAIAALARRCDEMCLAVGSGLGDAVPDLHDLSAQCMSLVTLLGREESAAAARELDTVAEEVAAIGIALTTEQKALRALIKLNHVLAHRIDDLGHHVRFLAAVVSNVKIELSYIEQDDTRLEGFADSLSQLTAKSQETLRNFQSTHERLMAHLQRTNRAQSLFETSHRAKLLTAGQEIRAGVEAISKREGIVANIAAGIRDVTRKVGTDIGMCVVALQIGDCTRQRLEHVAAALEFMIADVNEDGDPVAETADRTAAVAVVCRLQEEQADAAIGDLETEARKISASIAQIADANLGLLTMSYDLVGSPTGSSRSFLTELDRKVALARDLIGECGQSRRQVDETATAVVTSATALERMASNVAAMAIDMTIIGTNAVVTSHRLGNRGLALSVIAQHLRAHALRVAEEVDRVRPVLGDVLGSAHEFTTSRQRQNSPFLESLADRMSLALGVFRDSDRAVSTIRTALETKVHMVGDLLLRAQNNLPRVDEIAASTRSAIHNSALKETEDDQTQIDPDIMHWLRERYTMGDERQVHDRFFGSRQDHKETIADVEDMFIF